MAIKLKIKQCTVPHDNLAHGNFKEFMYEWLVQGAGTAIILYIGYWFGKHGY